MPPRLITCRYTGQRGQGVAVMTVMVRKGQDASESRIGFQSAKEQFADVQTVPGVGEDAFWIGNQLNVLQGDTYLIIGGDFELETAKSLGQTAARAWLAKPRVARRRRDTIGPGAAQKSRGILRLRGGTSRAAGRRKAGRHSAQNDSAQCSQDSICSRIGLTTGQRECGGGGRSARTGSRRQVARVF
jgi:hypothetical protein